MLRPHPDPLPLGGKGFGNKAASLRAAVERYSVGPGSHGAEVLATARAVTRALLEGAADVQTAPGNPGGCLLVQGALACGDEARPLRQELAARRAAHVEMFRARMERAQEEGDLPADADPAALSQYIATVIHGMAVQAAGGATRAELQKVIDVVMKAWPS